MRVAQSDLASDDVSRDINNLHTLLRRQLKKHFREAPLPPAFVEFLRSVNKTYEQNDRERAALERSLDLSSQELLQVSSETRAILQALPDLFFLIDSDGNVLSCKSGGNNNHPKPRKPIAGRKLTSLFPVEEATLFESAIRQAKDRQAVTGFEYSHQAREKHYFYKARLVPLADDRMVVVIRDITERKAAEEALREGERFLSDIFSSMQDGISILDTEMRIVRVNPRMEKWYKHAMPIAGKKCFEVYHGAQRTCVGCPCDYTLRTGQTGRTILPKVGPGGQVTGWLELFSFPLTDKSTGSMKGVIEYVRDITKRKLAEEALRLSENLYRTIFENTGTAAVVINEDDTIGLANSGFEKLSGYARNDLEDKKRLADFIPEEDLPKIDEYHVHREGEAIVPSSYECRFVEREGAVKDCISNVCMIPGSRRFVVSILDITDMKRLQGQLVQAQKMEAIGTLAGGIAHDFNNLLMGIQGYSSLMLLDTERNSPQYDRLKGIEEHVRSGAELTRQLLGCARGGKYEVRPISLNDVLEKTATMFGRTKKEIAIHYDFEPDLWTVEADQGEIERVLLNLFLNASQAMPGGGELFLETRNVVLGQQYVQLYGLNPGMHVKISTTDTGVGMDEKTRSRIFEPFFTTQEMGRGTGLGLASVYGIIQAHDGIINVYSEKGHGSTFTIYLPASDKEKTEERARPEDLIHGTEGILLVDDEPAILDIGTQVLEILGYTVFPARSGREAVELFGKNKNKVDVVILDMIMPQMSGGETFDLLKSIDPNVRVILSSGYSITGEAHKIVERGCRAFIQKPFTPVDLSRKIREALDEAG